MRNQIEINASRAFSTKCSETFAGTNAGGDKKQSTLEILVGLVKQNMYGTCDAASNWERDWEEHLKRSRCHWEVSSKNCFDTKGTESHE